MDVTLLLDPETRARYRALVDAIELPQPFSLEAFVESVARQRSCDIDLQPLSPELGPEVSGLVARTETGYVIQYPVNAEPWWGILPVSHEVAHVICGHVPGEGSVVTRRVDGIGSHLPAMAEAAAAWGPLYRCQLAADIEQEAEFVASLLVHRIEHLRHGSHPSATETSAILGRFDQVFGSRGDRRR